MKHKFNILRLISFIILIGISINLNAQTTYYIDFENGSDTNNGTSETTAWKHAPGDENAVNNPSAVELQAGDVILFRGGTIYRGSIKMLFDGEEDNPITYKGDGWGEEKAIIDGSEILNNWTACSSQADAMGNPNWQNIYHADIPESVPGAAVNLQEEGEFLWVSQEPDMPEPFFNDEHEYFFEVPENQQTTTTLTDPNNFNQSDPNYWDGSSLLLWTLPNLVVLREITGYDPAQNTVTYEEMNDPSGYNQYSIYNSIHAIDNAGEYYCSPEIQNNQKRIYLWPRNTANISNNQISYSARTYGFNIYNKNYLVIEGFEIVKFSGDDIREGIGIGSYTSAHTDKTGIVVRNNYIHHNSHAARGYGAIFLSKCHNSLVENNEIKENKGQPAIFIASSNDVVVQDNNSFKAGATSFKFYTCENIKVLHNTVSEGRGTHSNGMTFYISCNNVLVDGNKVMNSNICLTYQNSNNLTFINNIFDGYENTTYVAAAWSGNTGYVNFLNNTIIGSTSDYSLYYNPESNDATFNIINNIIDGGGGSNANHTHNIYVGEAWNQEPMAEGEFVETNTDLIFEDLANQDYSLLENSAAKDVGTNTSSYMPSSIFRGYNFNQDITETLRPQGDGWDIGAYEYDLNQIPEGDDDETYILHDIFPNPMIDEAIIPLDVFETAFFKLDVMNIHGQHIRNIQNGELTPGSYDIEWNGKNKNGSIVAKGTYLITIQINDVRKLGKIVMFK